jgi:5'(3')-deoxyribonucleotidase
MKKIALDFDNVLSDTMIAWTKKYNEKYNKNLTKDDIRSWAFWKDFGIDHSQAMEIFNEAWTDWPNLPPTEDGLADTITGLAEYGTVDIVTEIDDSHLVGVKKWLDQNGIEINEIIHGEGKKISKPYDLFIDDSPSLAEQAMQYDKNCYIYDQKWNKHIEPSKNVLRIHSLTDAITKIADKGL